MSDRTAKRASIREEKEAISVYDKRARHVKNKGLKKAIKTNERDEREHKARLEGTLRENLDRAK